MPETQTELWGDMKVAPTKSFNWGSEFIFTMFQLLAIWLVQVLFYMNWEGGALVEVYVNNVVSPFIISSLMLWMGFRRVWRAQRGTLQTGKQDQCTTLSYWQLMLRSSRMDSASLKSSKQTEEGTPRRAEKMVCFTQKMLPFSCQKYLLNWFWKIKLTFLDHRKCN